MKKSVFAYLCLIVVSGLCSCNRVLTPEYASVDKINNLRAGMSPNEVIQTLGVKPYDFYYQSIGETKTIFFYYKHKERAVIPGSENYKSGLTGGTEKFVKESSLYVTFKEDQLYQITSKDGKDNSLDIMSYSNTIKTMNENKPDFIEPEGAVSFNKDYTPVYDESVYMLGKKQPVKKERRKKKFEISNLLAPADSDKKKKKEPAAPFTPFPLPK